MHKCATMFHTPRNFAQESRKIGWAHSLCGWSVWIKCIILQATRSSAECCHPQCWFSWLLSAAHWSNLVLNLSSTHFEHNQNSLHFRQYPYHWFTKSWGQLQQYHFHFRPVVSFSQYKWTSSQNQQVTRVCCFASFTHVCQPSAVLLLTVFPGTCCTETT